MRRVTAAATHYSGRSDISQKTRTNGDHGAGGTDFYTVVQREEQRTVSRPKQLGAEHRMMI